MSRFFFILPYVIEYVEVKLNLGKAPLYVHRNLW